MGEITTFDQIILIPICSLLFLIVVGLITHIFKMQAKRTDEKYQETDDKIELLEKAGKERFKTIEKAGKQRDETLLAIQEFGREANRLIIIKGRFRIMYKPATSTMLQK